jgi:acetate kinase
MPHPINYSLVFHYASDVDKLSPSSTSSLHISRAEEILNKRSGWKSLTGTTDFGAIVTASAHNPTMKLALDLFVDRVCSFIGSYYVTLHGCVDALVFAGGIGERSALLRSRVVGNCKCLGFDVDEGLNEGVGETGGVVLDVSAAEKWRNEGKGEKSKQRVLVCRTDEQFEMARGCAADERLFS